MDLSPEEMRQRLAMLETLVAERNKQLENANRDRKVAQSEAVQAKALYSENLRLKDNLKECNLKQRKLEDENRKLRAELGVKDHRDTISRFQQMLDGDQYDQAGPVASWERQKAKEAGLGEPRNSGSGGGQAHHSSQPLQQPQRTQAMSTNPLSQSRAPPGTNSGSKCGTAAAGGAISSLGFGSAGSSRPRFGFGCGGGPSASPTGASDGVGPTSTASGDSLNDLIVINNQIGGNLGGGSGGGTSTVDGQPSFHSGATPTQTQMPLGDGGADDPEVFVSNEEVDDVMQRALDEATLERKDDDELEERLRRLMKK